MTEPTPVERSRGKIVKEIGMALTYAFGGGVFVTLGAVRFGVNPWAIAGVAVWLMAMATLRRAKP